MEFSRNLITLYGKHKTIRSWITLEHQLLALVISFFLYLFKRENKNYTEPAKKLLTEKLLSLVYEESDIKIVHTKVHSIKGEAQINIRKGK